MTDNLDKVKDRIAKLLAKANNNSNEHEAELAASRARALMDKYQLDEMSISVHADQDMFDTSVADKAYTYMPKWRNWIATAAARYNDCHCRVISGGRKRVLIWQGYKEDAALAKQMYDYLCDVVDAATAEHQKTLDSTRYNARLGTVFKESMATRISYRLAMMAEARSKEVVMNNGTGLAVYKMNQVDEHFGAASYSQGKTKKSSDMDLDELKAAVAGIDAGDAANLIKTEGITA